MSILSFSTWNVSSESAAGESAFGSSAWIFVSAVLVAIIAPYISYRSKLAEFRKSWTDELRKDIADYMGLARVWIEDWDNSQDMNLTEDEKKARFDKQFLSTNEALVIYWRIVLRINPRENKFSERDRRFIRSMDNLLNPGAIAPHPVNPAEVGWRNLAKETIKQAQEILKEEWQVTKRPFPDWMYAFAHKLSGLFRRA